MNSREALRGVPREIFVPDEIWVRGDDWLLTPLRRQDEPDEWARLVASEDEAIITRVSDAPWPVPTSSSSAPAVMAEMIDALALAESMGVLEIGTGTGYNAAVMCAITGTRVVSIEVAPDVAAQARAALIGAGYPVEVVTGDGAQGVPAFAPFDRVIATAAVRDVPYAWVEQTRPGGRVVMPWRNDLVEGGRLLVLDVSADGSAAGRFGGGLSFMPLRQQPLPKFVPWVSDNEEGDYEETTTRVDPREVLDGRNRGAKFAIGLRLPGCTDGRTINEDGTETFRLSHFESGSWAGFTPGNGEHVVKQHGTRRLWDELEAAYSWWLEADRPGPDRFGITVTPQGQTIWLDSPTGMNWSV
ncbi:methyltransferase domain-containing protein [Actinomadura syzygii]|uniref:Protein-L-isoaspartate O-methyltransferase n=1 Tax=Actinomadura syzygii TaxID=1427538 RepID=A0A5D0ULA2_9ACTN|nr:methyltransferase domain-containing protein [Actinomadura syzygii]TYC18393.1 protein-L-isoaspartate(D-aspartate) O-methyltransferase [Actinomadura syzygii]